MEKATGVGLAAAAAALVGAGAMTAVLGTSAVTARVVTRSVPAVVAGAVVPRAPDSPAAPAAATSAFPVISTTTTAAPAPSTVAPPAPVPTVATAGRSGDLRYAYYHPVTAGPVTVGPVTAGMVAASVQPANPLAGLASPPAGWTAAAHTVDVGGLTRTYLTVAPQTLTAPAPVVVLMHGLDMNAAGVLDMTGLDARTGPAIIVAPQGWEESWNAGGCCGPAFRAGIDDVDFIRAAVAQVLAANTRADPSRVYAVGFSNGGRMAYRLACDLSGTFAGFLAAEAVPVDHCSARRPLDEVIIAQQGDPLLSVGADQAPKYMDGSREPTVASVIAHQQVLDGCSPGATLRYAGVAEIRTWPCADRTRLTYVWYPGGSHSWRRPSGATPGATDMVLELMGGQLLTDRGAPVS